MGSQIENCPLPSYKRFTVKPVDATSIRNQSEGKLRKWSHKLDNISQVFGCPVPYFMSCFALCLREGNATAKKPSTPRGVGLISMRHRSNTKFREITYVIVSIGIRLTHNLTNQYIGAGRCSLPSTIIELCSYGWIGLWEGFRQTAVMFSTSLAT